jgi:hypothetical protein
MVKKTLGATQPVTPARGTRAPSKERQARAAIVMTVCWDGNFNVDHGRVELRKSAEGWEIWDNSEDENLDPKHLSRVGVSTKDQGWRALGDYLAGCDHGLPDAVLGDIRVTGAKGWQATYLRLCWVRFGDGQDHCLVQAIDDAPDDLLERLLSDVDLEKSPSAADRLAKELETVLELLERCGLGSISEEAQRLGLRTHPAPLRALRKSLQRRVSAIEKVEDQKAKERARRLQIAAPYFTAIDAIIRGLQKAGLLDSRRWFSLSAVDGMREFFIDHIVRTGRMPTGRRRIGDSWVDFGERLGAKLAPRAHQVPDSERPSPAISEEEEPCGDLVGRRTTVVLSPDAPPPVVHPHLAAVYRDTDYVVEVGGHRHIVRIDEPCPGLDGILTTYTPPAAAILTAYNPGSVLLSEAANAKTQTHLRMWLTARRLAVFEAMGNGRTGNWPPEPSLCAVGISRDVAHDLAWEFGQLAFVFLACTGRAELVWTQRFRISHLS